MPQEGEAGAAMHLPHDPFRFGVHAFGPAVVVWLGHGRVHGFFVQVEAAGESVQVGQVGRADGGDPFLEVFGVVLTRSEECGEAAHEPGRLDHLGAGRRELVAQLPLAVGEVRAG